MATGGRRGRAPRSIALVLGAGASKTFGYPLTTEILPIIVSRLRSRQRIFSFANAAKCRELTRCLQAVLPGYRCAGARASITDVVSLVDHSILHDRSPSSLNRAAELQDWRSLLVEAAIEVICDTRFRTVGRKTLNRLSGWIAKTSRAAPGRLGIVSTNYDISVEYPLFRRQHAEKVAREWDFGFAWRHANQFSGRIQLRPSHPTYRLFKLHGAVNWLRCRQCEQVYMNPEGYIADLAFRSTVDEYNTCHCGQPRLQLLVVPPSGVRDVRDPVLLQIWSNALEFMRGAEEWVIVGYSLPPEDIAIRSLLLRAYRARHEPPRVVVVQRQSANTEATRGRYRALFPRCEYLTNELSGWLASEGA